MSINEIENSSVKPSLEDWVQLAETTLKGRSVNDLSFLNEDGILINALYSSANHSNALSDEVSASAAGQWVVAQYLEPEKDSQKLNAMILDELSGGTEQIIFTGSQALEIVSKSMTGVMADAIIIAFENPKDINIALNHLLDIWKAQDVSPEFARGSIGALVSAETSQGLCTFTADHSDILKHYPNLRILKISGADAHRKGATVAQEIAVILSTFTMLLRDAEKNNVQLADIVNVLEFDLAMDADLYGGLAKARALRNLLDRMIAATGQVCSDLPSRLHGITSDRMLSLIDAETNMLRNGTAMLSMALAGLGKITNRPHDWLSGSSSLSRRIARNAHHLLADEAQLTIIADPAQGSYYIDTLTKDLTDKAWSLFQEIERQGGINSDAADTLIQSWFDEAHQKRLEKVNQGQDALLGVSIHPVSGSANIQDIIEDQISGQFIKRGGNTRPSSPWEDLVRSFQSMNIKCLLLDIGAGQTAKTVKRLVDIFGFESAAMNAEDAAAAMKLIKTAKPDIVIFNDDIDGAEQSLNEGSDFTIFVSASAFSGDIISEMTSIFNQLSQRSAS